MMSPKIVKSISLDERTAPIANEKNNFSAWVREQLLNEISYTIPCTFFEVHHLDRAGKQILDDYYTEDGQKLKRKRITAEICNGMKKPHCSVCYPEGPPEGDDWRLYTRRQIDRAELLERASKRWKWRTDALKDQTNSKNQEKEPFTPHSRPRKAYVRRLLVWIWSYIW
jgi:hypothetical protein